MSGKAGTADSVDWFNVWTQYLKANAESGISARAYLLENGLNANSGRRNFANLSKLYSEQQLAQFIAGKPLKNLSKKPAKSGSLIESGSPKKASGSPSKRSTKSEEKRSTNAINSENKSSKTNELKTGRKNGASHGGSPNRKKVSDQSKRLTIQKQMDLRDNSSDAQIGNGGKFQRGNGASVSSGRYMDVATHADDDIKKMVAGNDSDELGYSLMQLEEIRYLQMTRIMNDRVEKISACPEVELPKDENGNPLERDDLIRQSYWGASPALSSMFSTISMARNQAAKAAIDIEQRRFKLAREQFRLDALKDTLSRRTDETSAIDMATRLELQGITPPPLLVRQALKEIEMMAPKVDTSGVTNEELDALTAEAERNALEQTRMLLERAQQLPDLFERARLEAEQANAAVLNADDEDLDGDGYIELNAEEPAEDEEWGTVGDSESPNAD